MRGLDDVAWTLEHVFVYGGRYSAFRGRSHGRAPAGLPGQRFVGYLQNHDQIGNRATGERSGHLMSASRLKVAAALVLTAPFVPMLFQGEEWGASTPFLYFTDHEDAALAEAVTRGRREEFAAFGWDPAKVPDPQSAETFDRSRLDWSERAREPHAGLLEWHRALIRLRRRTPTLRDGRLERDRARADVGAGWLVVERDAVVVACNIARERHDVPIPHGELSLGLASAPNVHVGAGAVALPPDSVAVLVRA